MMSPYAVSSSLLRPTTFVRILATRRCTTFAPIALVCVLALLETLLDILTLTNLHLTIAPVVTLIRFTIFSLHSINVIDSISTDTRSRRRVLLF